MEALRFLQQHLPAYAIQLFRLCVWLALLTVIFAPLERLFALHPKEDLSQGHTDGLGLLLSQQPDPKLVTQHAARAGGLERTPPHPEWSYRGNRSVAGMAAHCIGPGGRRCWILLGPPSEPPNSLAVAVPCHSSQRGRFGLSGKYARSSGRHGIYPPLRPGSALHLRSSCTLARQRQSDSIAGASVRHKPGAFLCTPTYDGASVPWNFWWPRQRFITGITRTTVPLTSTRISHPCCLGVDKIFGTLYLPADQRPTRYGIDEKLAPGLLGQLFEPFTIRRSDSSSSVAPDSTAAENVSHPKPRADVLVDHG